MVPDATTLPPHSSGGLTGTLHGSKAVPRRDTYVNGGRTIHTSNSLPSQTLAGVRWADNSSICEINHYTNRVPRQPIRGISTAQFSNYIVAQQREENLASNDPRITPAEDVRTQLIEYERRHRQRPWLASLRRADRMARKCRGKAAGELVFGGRDGGYLPRAKSSNGWFRRAVTADHAARFAAHLRLARGVGRRQCAGCATGCSVAVATTLHARYSPEMWARGGRATP
jgi:hypothetical protein